MASDLPDLRWTRNYPTLRHLVQIAAAVVLPLAAAGCTADDPALAADPVPTVTASPEEPTPAPSPTRTTRTPTPRPTPTVPEVRLNCWQFDDYPDTDRVTITDGHFADAWDGEYDMCEDATRNAAPLTEIEQQAFDTSGYDDDPRSGITTLYVICVEIDPHDTYTSGEHVASPEQADEIDAVLMLCPDHPFADEMGATAARGRQDTEWEEAGRLFRTGTFLIGDEIQPGTYVIEREIENCYWERQDSTGQIIENNFIISTRRVEVTIRATDYAFHNQGCGTWRPAD